MPQQYYLLDVLCSTPLTEYMKLSYHLPTTTAAMLLCTGQNSIPFH